jgi:hypothetical protein
MPDYSILTEPLSPHKVRIHFQIASNNLCGVFDINRSGEVIWQDARYFRLPAKVVGGIEVIPPTTSHGRCNMYTTYRETAGCIRNELKKRPATFSDTPLFRNPYEQIDNNDHTPHDIEEQKETTMTSNTNEMLTILQLQQGAKIVSAVYINGNNEGHQFQRYHFKNCLGLALKEGDMVVCETKDSFSLLAVKDPDVRATECGCGLGVLKHVVAKVRSDDYEGLKATEAEVFHKLALSEVTSRLTTYRDQIGADTYREVERLICGEACEDAEVVEE